MLSTGIGWILVEEKPVREIETDEEHTVIKT